MRHLVWLLVLGIACAACSEPDERRSEQSPPVRGKHGAPVEVLAPRIDERGADLEVAFEADARHVAVRARSTDGLTVLGEPELVTDASYRQGERVRFSVPFDPGSAPGLLVVEVEGTFAGRAAVRVVTFTVGSRAAAAMAPDADVVESDGERLRVTRARER